MAGQNTGDVTMVLCNAKKAKKSVAGRIQFETRDWEQHDELPEDFEEEGREVPDDEE